MISRLGLTSQILMGFQFASIRVIRGLQLYLSNPICAWARGRRRLRRLGYQRNPQLNSVVFVTFKVLDPRAGVKNDHAFARGDFLGTLKQFQSSETRRSLWTDEEAFL